LLPRRLERSDRGRPARQSRGREAVGIAGGPEKCAFMKKSFRFDAAVDIAPTIFQPN